MTGEAVGQVNGLAVGQVGDTTVGRPVRISARAGPGAEGVVDIERLAQLGGRVHSKAVMILQGFITGRYAHDAPLALDATLTFEQTYEEIDGDSASLGELAALVSALAEVPVRQGVAITGSLSQDGQAQPVGAVTHKIEAFFAACSELGLDGTQGVVLGASNVQHLNLREEVCAAVSAGRFHVWAVKTADEALELLLGQPMGARRADGSWEEGTVNAKVARPPRADVPGGAPPAAEARPSSASARAAASALVAGRAAGAAGPLEPMTDRECVELLQWALPTLGLRWRGFSNVRGQVCKRLGRRAKELGLDAAAYRRRLERGPRRARGARLLVPGHHLALLPGPGGVGLPRRGSFCRSGPPPRRRAALLERGLRLG